MRLFIQTHQGDKFRDFQVAHIRVVIDSKPPWRKRRSVGKAHRSMGAPHPDAGSILPLEIREVNSRITSKATEVFLILLTGR